MTTTHHTFCRICESLCGLEIDVDGDQIVQIRPDKNHVATRGYGCVKGLKQHKIYNQPDRVLQPLKKVGDEHIPISWEQALAEIGAKVKQLRTEHSPQSVGMYVGTAAGFGALHPIFAQGFMDGVGSGSLYATATQDCANKFSVAREVYGFPFTQPFPDVDHIDTLIIVGANPAISKWSFLQVSNPMERLREIQARGGKVLVVDPRRTETAKVATDHVFIRPNTDVFFYLSFLNEVIRRGAVKRDRVDAFMTGFDEVAALAEPWTPERTAEVTRIPADTLRGLVDAYLAADGAALYCSTGVNMGNHGSLGYWLQEVINAITGNLDRRGGTLVGVGVIDFPKFGARTGLLLKKDRSRVGDFQKTNDALPGGVMADEILTPGREQLRALFVTGGNPLLAMANAGRLREAFEKLELLVCLDIQMSETASMANYVLPCTTPLERPDLPFIFPLMLGLQSKPYLQATEPVLPITGEQRDEATIYMDLARASGVSLFGSKPAQKALEWATRRADRKRGDGRHAIPQEGLLNMLLRATGQQSFRSLLRHPHGWLRPDHQERSFLGLRVTTEDGKVHLAPERLMDAAKNLPSFFESHRDDPDGLRLITRRAITTHNTWTHNIEDFVRGPKATNYLYVHPDDAERLGLEQGGLADVESATATVRLPVHLLADLMPGTVALPHGWGHQRSKMHVASKTRGVNVNLLAADGPDALERVSGMAHLTGIPVDVRPASGPKDDSTWSGLPAQA